jgi:hypothetical protein
MVKKLIKHGNSAALVIDKPILSPQIENNQENTVIHSLEKINKKYGAVLKRLGE